MRSRVRTWALTYTTPPNAILPYFIEISSPRAFVVVRDRGLSFQRKVDYERIERTLVQIAILK